MRAYCAAFALSLACASGGVSVSDRRPPVPALPNLPPDTLLTVARSGVPRSEVLYYRTIVGVIFDDTTSGATVRSVLARYDGSIIGGVPGDNEYIVRIKDPGETLAALDAVVSRLHDEPGVRLARKVYRRWIPQPDAAPGHYIVTGRIIDSQQRVPVAAAAITSPSTGAEARSDSGGAFQLRVSTPPGCHQLRVSRIGYGGTVRTVALREDSVLDVADVPLRATAIPEWRLLLVLGCSLPDSVRVRAEWGIDTVRIAH